RKSLTWPIAGPLIRQFNASYTVRSIGLLLDATDLNTALKLTAEARLNVVYGEMVEDILEVVRTHGMTLSDAVAPYAHLMGDEMNGIVSAGESSGKVTQQFIRYANMLDERIRREVESMSRVIEPLMIVMVAAIIAPIIIASYLPLFELIGQLAGK